MPTEREFAGEVLHGDDFDEEQIAAWYHDEENAFAELYASDPNYEYEFEALNRINGFDQLPVSTRFPTTVGLGSAYGDELRPIAGRIDRLIIVESADTYRTAPALDVPTDWRKASMSGDLDLPDNTADLVTCFGVLHHIPNVTHVLSEMSRVTKPGGYALLREPVISMGDWTKPRPGLTPRERGIPAEYLVNAAQMAGYEVLIQRWCFFSLLNVLGGKFKIDVHGRPGWVRLDAALSKATRSRYRYHASTRWQKVRPTSMFLVLRKLPAAPTCT